MSKDLTKEDPRDDDDLDDLDDLLDDFAGEVLSKPPGSAKSEDTKIEDKKEEINLQDLIKDLNIQDPETKDQFEKLIKDFEDESKDPKNFDSVMKDTMERLKTSGKNIDEQIKNDQANVNPEDMLTQLLSGLGGGDKDLDMSKLLVDMLEQLSSKEVLYEPIKDLNTKFPEYLKDKKGKIPDEEYQNYNKQYEITVQIVEIFESPDFNDDDKQQRDHVNSLLESLQELGQPPTELVGDSSQFPGFGGSGSNPFGDLGFSDKDLPKDFEKDLEEGCQQQ
ncbi:peroxisomal membrane protein import receptor Pex19p [[Candida] jaroonii]|uniref:Peroxisomal membrane protein import receptor Pex19p n=1 Tax=[Candida] jaroonii TaxID=467808 RepID=A0ACA9Y8J9_9ASCO|nr:peroxisomal membrane protein import receptor Pex19p [[Candida] jaroonii]